MRNVASLDPGLHRRLVDGLYLEAMMMADEARAYFDGDPLGRGETVDPLRRVSFACESLKVTTRLMHVIAWLLTQRAVIAGELTPAQAQDSARRLGTAPVSEEAIVATLPEQARAMVAGSIDLHRRVERLDAAQVADEPMESPARSMLDRLATSF
ncbi:MAG: DUF1465 family protein [Pseudomonadota bacterium]|nr:DUF1465 family protein [Pseudomonadota bacterium]